MHDLISRNARLRSRFCHGMFNDLDEDYTEKRSFHVIKIIPLYLYCDTEWYLTWSIFRVNLSFEMTANETSNNELNERRQIPDDSEIKEIRI